MGAMVFAAVVLGGIAGKLVDIYTNNQMNKPKISTDKQQPVINQTELNNVSSR
jgi:hypothetical protein